MSACDRATKWELVVALFDSSSKSIELNLICLNAIMSACHRGDQWENALSLLTLQMWSNLYICDQCSVSIAIAACEKGELW